MSDRFYDYCPALLQRYDVVAALPLTNPALIALRDKIIQPADIGDLTMAIDRIHRLQRLYFASHLNLLENDAIVAALTDEKNFTYWKDYAAIQATPAQKNLFAKQLYEGHAPLSPVTLFVGNHARDVAEKVLQHCLDVRDQTDIWIDDAAFARRLLHVLDKDGVVRYATLSATRYDNSKRRIVVLADGAAAPYIDAMPDEELEALRYNTFMGILNERGTWLGQKFTGAILPSREDAKQDGLDFDDYMRLFFAMCEIDMAKIDAAHKVLIGYLNPAETVRITNTDGTDITFGIQGMTFESSLIDYNIPGTEVFSAPEREKVDGIIVAKGWFNVPMGEDKRIRDITLEFEKGRIVRCDATEGVQYLREMIEKDEGSHYLGELAFGTNPALMRHVSNALLVEKIGGSFHVAIGRAYPNTPDAVINNGNVSMVHWDITTMLRDRGGMIDVDGKTIMRDGRYIDPALAYLNGDI